MKPKTRLQIEVWNLHKKLSIPREHEGFLKSKHELYYTTHYKNLVCLECNHNWKPEMAAWKEEVIGVICPSCKNKLKKIDCSSGSATRILSYSVVQVAERFQVIRYFSCWKHLSKNKKPTYHFRSLFEEWKDWDKNKKVIVGRIPTWTGDGFTSSDFEVRACGPSAYKLSEYDRFASDINCPGAEFLPRFKKYGLKKDFHNCDYRMLLERLQMSSKIETLLKTKQKELLFHAVHKNGNYGVYWPQIKIALRHKYKIKDAGMWYDYLQLLREYGKDLHNPKFICPINLKAEHDRYMKKKQSKQEAERRERDRITSAKRQQNLEKVTAEYLERCQKFFDLNFVRGDISIQVLQTIDEFREEGSALKHCVYTNEYYAKKDSLVLSARVKGERTETIEVYLSKLTISQARGFGNKPTEYHDDIVNLLKENLHKIQAVLSPKRKAKPAIVQHDVAA